MNVVRKKKKKKKNSDAREYALILGIIFAVLFGLYVFIHSDQKKDSPKENPAEIIPIKKMNFNAKYTTKVDVANYICQFGTLPHNYVDNHQAQAIYEKKTKKKFIEWNINPQKTLGIMIGNDYVGDYNKRLPPDNWFEADVDYDDSSRGTKRLIFGSSCNIYYSSDLYKSFTKLEFRQQKTELPPEAQK